MTSEEQMAVEHCQRMARHLRTKPASSPAARGCYEKDAAALETLLASHAKLEEENRRLKQSDHKTPSERQRDADNWEDLPW